MILRNYFKVALRNFTKRKLYSFINAFGLSIAIAFSLLVYVFISDELSFDTFHVNRDRIYRIDSKNFDRQAFDLGSKNPYYYQAILPNRLPIDLQDQPGDWEYITLIKSVGQRPILHKDKSANQKITFTDSNFFDMFSFTLIAGSVHKLMQDPTDAVITQEIATSFFGDEDPIGKTIFLDFDQVTVSGFTVKAVVECPQNSSIQFEVLLPLESYEPFQQKAWNVYAYPTFVQLRKNVTPETFKVKLDTLINRNKKEWFQQVRKENNLPADFAVSEIILTKLTDVHFETKTRWSNASDPQYSWTLGGIAFLILCIASINYISFALTLSVSRRKEIGIRKTIGATGMQIFQQFNIESVTLSVFAALLGIGLAIVSLPLFNELTQKVIPLSSVDFMLGSSFLILMVFFIAFLAGSYPALIVSRVKPVLALKPAATGFKVGFARPLVIVQFTMSAFLMISALIMYRQMKFITTKNLGYDSQHVISVPTNAGWNDNSDKAITRFRSKTQNNPHIIAVSGMNSSFNQGYNSMSLEHEGLEKQVYFYRADYKYLSLFDIQLLAGRNFNEGEGANLTSVIVNEAMVKAFEWSDPLTETVAIAGTDGPRAMVIGVVKDFHFRSLEEEILPVVITADPIVPAFGGGFMGSLLIKLNAHDIPAAIHSAEQEWKSLYPDKPFDYTFVDEDVALQYKSYTRWMKITATATVLAIVIACLGLFGLSGINALGRTKEIGIRKILGADFKSIFITLNKPFIVLAIVAFILAIPASWYAMNVWLNNFVYRITIGWEIFAISIFSGVIVALISVSYHGIKSAHSNPAETLKYE